MIGQGDQVQRGQCVVDFSVTPHHLDLIVAGKTGYSIFEFTTTGLKLAEPQDDENQRPTEFNHGTLVFKRVMKPQPKPTAPKSKAPQAPPAHPTSTH